MDARHPVLRHGEHAERIIVAQVPLGGEGKAGEVGQRPDLVWMHAGGVELGPVDRRVLVGVIERPFQAFQLQGL
jgi:hypothetical protein